MSIGKIVLGTLVIGSLAYVTGTEIYRILSSRDTTIVAKNEIIEGAEPLDLYLAGYSLITELDLGERVLRETTTVKFPDEEYYKRMVPGYSTMPSSAWQQDVKKFQNDQNAFLRDSLTAGRSVRLWLGDNGKDVTYHELTPDRVELL
jgi:hypothetical protein